jgi:hypothetical protein
MNKRKETTLSTKYTKHIRGNIMSINQYAEIAAAKNGLNVNSLSYIGFTDCSYRGEGCKLYQWQVSQPGHAKHKSSIAIKSWEV